MLISQFLESTRAVITIADNSKAAGKLKDQYRDCWAFTRDFAKLCGKLYGQDSYLLPTYLDHTLKTASFSMK